MPFGLHNMNAAQFILCLFEHHHEGVFITDDSGIIVYYNQVMARIDGLSPPRAVGRMVTEIYNLPENKSLVLNCIKTQRPIIYQPHLYHTADGKLVNSIGSCYPLFDKAHLVGTVCMVSDYSSLAENFANSGQSIKKNKINQLKAGLHKISFEALVGKNPAFLAAIDIAKRAANTPSPVMLIGETGTGKELFAKSIHSQSARCDKTFMAVNCAAIPETLLEGILFGTTKGAFTGAVDKAGLLETASGGTLFLDELSSMPMSLQVKLLRVLQDQMVRRVGSLVEIRVDLKIISAINIMPFEAIGQGLLRPDLFYRLGVVLVHIPPLRNRPDDIELLLRSFVKRFNKSMGKSANRVSPEICDYFQSCLWPGNVRELEHAVEAIMNYVDAKDSIITREHLESALFALRPESANHNAMLTTGFGQTIRPQFGEIRHGHMLGPKDEGKIGTADGNQLSIDNERDHIQHVLKLCHGNVAKSARTLGLSPQLLHYRMGKYGLKSQNFK